MTDDRAGDPARGDRPGAPGVDGGRASGAVRPGPPSVPFRIPVATSARSGRTPTMVPLTRRRGPRLGLRPPGAALAAAPTATETEPPPGVETPRSPVDAVTLPATGLPAPPAPSVPPATSRPAGPMVPTRPVEPATVETSHPAVPVIAALPPSEPPVADDEPGGPGDLAGPPPAVPAHDSPAVRHVRAAAATATPEPRRATAARVDQLDWAATSAVLTSVGARVAAWRQGWTWARTLRAFTATCAVFVVIVCGLAWGAASWVEAAVRQIGALDPDSSAIQDAAAQVGDQNFLVVGSDSRAGAPPSEDAGDTADVPGARTDTIMVVHVPEDRSAVTVVSFPRDLEIVRPACERWDPVSGAYSPQVLPPTPRVKLNSAYAAGGPRCVTRAVQELSGLAINRFLGVDFQGFEGMVDAVKGVPICVEQPVNDSILGPIIPQAGPTMLTGRQALDYVRARHVEGDPSSDYGRIQRQQRFLGALLRSVLSAGTLLDPGRLNGLVEAVSRSTFGENIGSDQLLALSQSLGSLDPRTVTFVTVPTTGVANDRGNEVLRRGEEQALFSALIDGRPLPGAPGAPAAPAPAPVAIRLVDARSPAEDAPDEADRDPDEGSGDSSGDDDEEDEEDDDEVSRFAAPVGTSADAVAQRLRAAGFAVAADGVPGSTGGDTAIRYSADQAATAQALSATVPSATLDPSATGSGTLVLTLGDDFDGRVRSADRPAGAAASPPVNPTITAADASCT